MFVFSESTQMANGRWSVSNVLERVPLPPMEHRIRIRTYTCGWCRRRVLGISVSGFAVDDRVARAAGQEYGAYGEQHDHLECDGLIYRSRCLLDWAHIVYSWEDSFNPRILHGVIIILIWIRERWGRNEQFVFHYFDRLLE